MSLAPAPSTNRWLVMDMRTKLEWELGIEGEELTLRREGTQLTAFRRETVGGKVVTLDHGLKAPIVRYNKDGARVQAELDEAAAIALVRWLEVGTVVGRRGGLGLMFVAVMVLLSSFPVDADPEYDLVATPFSPAIALVAVLGLVVLLLRRRRPGALAVLLEAGWYALICVAWLTQAFLAGTLEPMNLFTLLLLWPAVTHYKLHLLLRNAEPLPRLEGG
jgi:hypothetical protein